MKPTPWPQALVVAAVSYLACVLAQGFPQWSAGQPLAWFPTDPSLVVELLAFVSGTVAVFLFTRESVWGYPVGILNVLLYGYLFFAIMWHPANAALQIVWLGYLVEGWRQWAQGGEQRQERQITRLTPRQAWFALATVALLTPLIFRANTLVDGKAPFLDAITVAISLAAQYLQNRKVLECWIVWLVANSIYIPMYALRGWHATMLFAVFMFALAVKGFFDWRKTLAGTRASQPA